MRLPKRFKLHELTGKYEGILATPNWLIATDGHAAVAYIPMANYGDELPTWTTPVARRQIPVAIIKEATRGKLGIGLLNFLDTEVEATAGDGKPWVRHESPEPIELDAPRSSEPEGGEGLEVTLSLNAEKLGALAAAMGTDEVSLVFRVDPETGRMTASQGTIHVRPENRTGKEFGILAPIVNEGNE